MAAHTVVYPMPARFETIRHLMDAVRAADVAYPIDGCRWDTLIYNQDDNSLSLDGYWDSSPADGDFHIRIIYANNVLHYTVTSPFRDPAVVDFVVDHFLPAFHQFPQTY